MLRKLGMPVLLQKGVIMVLSDFKLCKEGKPITPQQSRLLVSLLLLLYSIIFSLVLVEIIILLFFQKLFGHKLDEFKVTLEYVWSKKDGSFEKL